MVAAAAIDRPVSEVAALRSDGYLDGLVHSDIAYDRAIDVLRVAPEITDAGIERQVTQAVAEYQEYLREEMAGGRDETGIAKFITHRDDVIERPKAEQEELLSSYLDAYAQGLRKRLRESVETIREDRELYGAEASPNRKVWYGHRAQVRVWMLDAIRRDDAAVYPGAKAIVRVYPTVSDNSQPGQESRAKVEQLHGLLKELPGVQAGGSDRMAAFAVFNRELTGAELKRLESATLEGKMSSAAAEEDRIVHLRWDEGHMTRGGMRWDAYSIGGGIGQYRIEQKGAEFTLLWGPYGSQSLAPIGKPHTSLIRAKVAAEKHARESAFKQRERGLATWPETEENKAMEAGRHVSGVGPVVTSGSAASPTLYWLEYNGPNGTTEAFVWALPEEGAVAKLREVVPGATINWVRRIDDPRSFAPSLEPGHNVYAAEGRGQHAAEASAKRGRIAVAEPAGDPSAMGSEEAGKHKCTKESATEIAQQIPGAPWAYVKTYPPASPMRTEQTREHDVVTPEGPKRIVARYCGKYMVLTCPHSGDLFLFERSCIAEVAPTQATPGEIPGKPEKPARVVAATKEKPFVLRVRQGREVIKEKGPYAKITDAVEAIGEKGKPGQTATVYDGGKVAQYRGGRATFAFGRTRWSRAD